MTPLQRFTENRTRRNFIGDLSKATVGSLLLSSPVQALANPKTWTVGEVMDFFIKESTSNPLPKTIDTLKAGSRDQQVTGIVTTMFATIPVIKEAIALGANFIIAHEPTFYNHEDNTDWLEKDTTYQVKRKLLAGNNIAVWRNHDYIHAHKPDGVYEGLLEKLGWQSYVQPPTYWLAELPVATSLATLIDTLKSKLGISGVRYIGNDQQPCKKVLLLPGAAGGDRQIKAIGEYNPDVAIVGELREWETAEYVRDTRAAGKNVALIVLGHTDSEDPGSAYMKSWINKNVPEIKVTHLHSGNPFAFG